VTEGPLIVVFVYPRLTATIYSAEAAQSMVGKDVTKFGRQVGRIVEAALDAEGSIIAKAEITDPEFRDLLKA
jgi:hypothetical protein